MTSMIVAFAFIALLHAEQVSNCIVGAGPGGVQLGHFFQRGGRDFAIFERSATAGSFFRSFPRQRRLISIQKKFPPDGAWRNFSWEFRLRHDWNSLLEDGWDALQEPAAVRMEEYTDELYPHADALARYLEDFAAALAPSIRFNATVEALRRDPADPAGFVVRLSAGGPVRCARVIMASGWRPRPHTVPGFADLPADQALDYARVPASGAWARGKRVLVLGFGNAALEVTKALEDHAQAVVLAGRRRPNVSAPGLRFSFFTHYVGDVRAVNAGFLDSVQLSGGDRVLSLPPAADADGGAAPGWQLGLFPCGDPPLACTARVERGPGEADCDVAADAGACDGRWVLVGEARDRRALERVFAAAVARAGAAAVELVAEDAAPPGQSGANETETERLRERRVAADWERKRNFGIPAAVVGPHPLARKTFRVRVRFGALRADRGLALLAAREMKASQTAPVRVPVHAVVRCHGWGFDDRVYDDQTRPALRAQKFPVLTGEFESENVPNLFFAGTLTHGNDFRRAAGGFIHGFRYNARALFRALEVRDGAEWPNKPIALADIPRHLEARLMSASGPYQMPKHVVDLIVLEKQGKAWGARYYEELPTRYAARFRISQPRLALHFQYGEKEYGPKETFTFPGATTAWEADQSTFLHPVLSFYAPCREEWSEHRLFLVEDLHTRFDTEEHSPFLRRFLKHVFRAELRAQLPRCPETVLSRDYSAAARAAGTATPDPANCSAGASVPRCDAARSRAPLYGGF